MRRRPGRSGRDEVRTRVRDDIENDAVQSLYRDTGVEAADITVDGTAPHRLTWGAPLLMLRAIPPGVIGVFDCLHIDVAER